MTSSDHPHEITQSTINDITKIFTAIQKTYETTGTIDEQLKASYYERLKVLPVGDEIIGEFEKVIKKLEKEAKKFNAPMAFVANSRKDADFCLKNRRIKKKRHVEFFVDFGKFFGKTIGKIGFKYCTETEFETPDGEFGGCRVRFESEV
jgi:hypothetical protein